jgi:hypothetical protein
MTFGLIDKAGLSFAPVGRRLVLVLAILSAPPCWAWNLTGHRLISEIAWSELHSGTRAEVARLLRAHPDYERWVLNAEPGERDRLAFIEAATWADLIRKDKRFYSAGREEATPVLSGFPDMKRHADWHYVNFRLDGRPGDPPLSGQLDKQLERQLATLASPHSSTAQLSYALTWFIHLLGDAHQPLHTCIRPDAKGQVDPQRQDLMLNNPFNPRKTMSTVHAFWDDLPGPPWLSGAILESRARRLRSAYPPDSSDPSTSPNGAVSASRTWIEESWRLARDYGYPANAEDSPTISEAFYKNAREITNRRLTLAAYRLAAVLNAVLSREKREKHDNSD